MQRANSSHENDHTELTGWLL